MYNLKQELIKNIFKTVDTDEIVFELEEPITINLKSNLIAKFDELDLSGYTINAEDNCTIIVKDSLVIKTGKNCTIIGNNYNIISTKNNSKIIVSDRNNIKTGKKSFIKTGDLCFINSSTDSSIYTGSESHIITEGDLNEVVVNYNTLIENGNYGGKYFLEKGSKVKFNESARVHVKRDNLKIPFTKTFSEVLESLQAGDSISRKVWNDENNIVKLSINKVVLKESLEEGKNISYILNLLRYDDKGNIDGYNLTPEDILSKDWEVFINENE